jgi:uncharacterized protein
MKIRFDEIPEEGLRLEINDESWFPDQEIKREGPVKVHLLIERKGVERVLLSGTIETTVMLNCDRCLQEYALPIHKSFKVDLEYSPESFSITGEYGCSSNEMDTVYLEEPVVDVYNLLSQQLFLLIPAKSLCSEQCQGLCPQCGMDLNTQECNCQEGNNSSPFAILSKLKK